MPYKCRYCHTNDDHYHAKDCPCKGYEDWRHGREHRTEET